MIHSVPSQHFNQSEGLLKKYSRIKLGGAGHILSEHIQDMQDSFAFTVLNTLGQLLSKPTDVSIQCHWRKDDGSLDEF